jgi:hypothetical protein
MGHLPKGFPLQQGFSLNKQDQIFLTDHVRWSNADQKDEPPGRQ